MAHPKPDSDEGSRAWQKRVSLRRSRGGLRTVLADATRNRLLELSKAGVGRKAVCETTGLDQHTLAKIKNGKTKRVRRETEKLILGVPFNAHCDHAVIDLKPSLRLVGRLTANHIGFTKSEIARRLGSKRPEGYASLNLKKRITAKRAMKIEQLYRMVTTV